MQNLVQVVTFVPEVDVSNVWGTYSFPGRAVSAMRLLEWSCCHCLREIHCVLQVGSLHVPESANHAVSSEVEIF